MHRRSAVDAVSLIRRYIEMVEAKPTNALHLIFIDWEKAFDRIRPEAITRVLLRYGVPPHMVRVISALIAEPTFRADMDGSVSDWFRQSSGIRQ
eukprot:4321761-Alexandrium_andersonii.AAC.1